MTNPVQSATAINLPAQSLAQNSENLTGWAVCVAEPMCVLIVMLGHDPQRLSFNAFCNAMRPKPVRRMIRARSMGALIDVHHLRYDPTATVATTRRDCIGRRELVIGPVLTTALVSPCDDLSRALDRLFSYRDDAERAALDVAATVTRWGGMVSIDGQRLLQRCGIVHV